ncbi:MAG TPA: VIT domain-containing protein [Verrucomicrobiae bacterium]|jgi:hypothetical protein
MTPWTAAAAKVWEDFCQRLRDHLRGSGADPDEVVDDLRRHVEVEIGLSKLSIVTEDDMRRILSRVGAPTGPETEPRRAKKGFLKWSWIILVLLFGVLLPVGTLMFEFFTGISAGVLFDPIPTWFQILAVALVPLANFWLWLAAFFDKDRWARGLGWVAGAAAGVAMFYSILYVTFIPFSAMAVAFFGLGLIPLAPYFGLLCTLLLRWRVRRRLGDGKLGRFWPALGLSFSLLALAQVPKFITYNGLVRAESDDPAIRRGGVNTLRRFGDEEIILRSCYGMDFREPEFDLVRWLGSGNSSFAADKAREIYFRVTGNAFNAVPPPSLFTRAGRWNALNDDFDFSWDDALGGEIVAGRLKGLSLQSSRLDALAEPAASVVYCEWTMEFKNVSQQQREARAQIALPPGSVVTRLTLWINGEEREAAFGGRSQTRQAYQQVAVEQRRDPVLVTTCGPDRVLLQCFPVPPAGGTMKVRIGITAPLVLDSPEHGTFQWPEFLERNFKISPELKHAAWMESPTKIFAPNSTFAAAHEAQKFSLHGNITDDSPSSVQVDCPAEAGNVWTPSLAGGQIIRQRIEASSPAPISRIVLVIDGSAGMKSWGDSLAKSVGQISTQTELAIIVATDPALTLLLPSHADPQLIFNLTNRLQHFHYSGGCDDLPALEQGWDLAAAAGHGAVIWIHDSQPVLLSPADSLRQRMERGNQSVSIFDLPLRPGPDRIAEQLDGLRSFKMLPRLDGTLVAGLKRQVDALTGKTRTIELIRERATNSAPEGLQVSRHIEQLWAKDEIAALAAMRQADNASSLAVEQQLVTPYSGAVVLETKKQYAENNLTPAALKTVPTIPEPSTWALLTIGGVLVFRRISRSRRV